MDTTKLIQELDSIEERREAILKGVRDILINCRKAIISIHNSKIDEAKQYIKQTEEQLSNLRLKARDDLYYYLINVEAEYVEAKALLAIIDSKAILDYDSLDVKPSSYILGMLDCIGELKRIALDLIRDDKYGEAVRIFDIMQEIYSSLMPLAIYDNIVQGLRRKLDQNRLIIESVREVITEEARRRSFLNELNR